MTPHLHGKLQAGLQPRELASPCPSVVLFPLKISLQITFLAFTASFWPAHCPGDPDRGHSPGVVTPCPCWGGRPHAPELLVAAACAPLPPGLFTREAVKPHPLAQGTRKVPVWGTETRGKSRSTARVGHSLPCRTTSITQPKDAPGLSGFSALLPFYSH